MRAGLDSKENSFCAREPAHRDRLAGQQGHGEEERAEGPCQGTGGAEGECLSLALLPHLAPYRPFAICSVLGRSQQCPMGEVQPTCAPGSW